MKTLYFEGAGWSSADISKKTIGNCRIRTAFHLDDGRAVYLEIIGDERNKNCNPDIYHWQYTGFVEACHYITDDIPNDDINKHRVTLPGEKNSGGWVTARTFAYSEEAILKYVNRLGASFDAVKVVPDLGGFRVFPQNRSGRGPDSYNYGDEFQLDPEMTARREAVYDKIYSIEKEELMRDRASNGKKFVHSPSSHDYPNFSLWVDEGDPGLLHLLRHFNGYNKHWTIRTDVGATLDDWMSTATETSLGRYAC